MVDVEVARLKVAVRVSPDGSGALMLTESSARRLRRALDKAGEGAHHKFDYMTGETVVYRPAGRVEVGRAGRDRTGASARAGRNRVAAGAARGTD